MGRYDRQESVEEPRDWRNDQVGAMRVGRPEGRPPTRLDLLEACNWLSRQTRSRIDLHHRRCEAALAGLASTVAPMTRAGFGICAREVGLLTHLDLFCSPQMHMSVPSGPLSLTGRVWEYAVWEEPAGGI